MRYLLPLLTLIASAGACAADAPVAQWGATGQLARLQAGETPLFSDCGLCIAGPGWKATAAQTNAQEVRRTEEGGTVTWTGTLAAAGIKASFVQKVRREGERIRVDCAVEAREPFETAGIIWRANVPVADARGARWLYGTEDSVQAAPLPQTLAQPYLLGSAEAPPWCGWLGERAGVRLVSGADAPARVQVQDDRQFGTPAFEFQVCATAPARLVPGRPVRLSFFLETLTPQTLAAEEAKMRRQQDLFHATGPLTIRAVTPDHPQVRRYERLELRLDLSATYDNPFDADDIDVSARFTSPTGRVLSLPGFLYRPYERAQQGPAEHLTPAGPPEWRVRFTPEEVGEYTYVVSVRDRNGTKTSAPGRVRVAPGQAPGFVRVSKEDPRYFAFDNGSPYFPIGANVCWAGRAGTYDYDAWFPRYTEAGANYARLWIGPFDLFTLERKPIPGRGDTGLSRFDQADAWRLDHVVNLAERQGIYLMLCIDSFNALRINPPYAYWADNPYSAANGGPLQKPEEFFTNEQARRHFRNRLRYLVARWGYSPHVLSWEFWNEVDIIQRYLGNDARAWHQEMSRALRAMDPWKHLQTTSYARSDGDPNVDGLPEMDYVQTHCYGPRDMAAELARWSRRKQGAFTKPHYVGEFGLDAGGPGGERDLDGLAWHNGLWATTMSGDAGAGMLWWWDNYIHPRNLYGHLAALAAFTKGIDWPREHFRRVEEAAVTFAQRPARPERHTLMLEGTTASWETSPANQPRTFVVPRSGKVAGLDQLSRLQHGVKNHLPLHNPATFQVEYAAPGKFLVTVDGVSGHGGAALKVTLDGRALLEKEFADPDGMQKTDTLTQYNGAYSVDVPVGPHTIVVENTGADWFFASYSLPDYAESWEPRLRAFALAGERTALAWVQHADHTWSRRADGVKIAPMAGTLLRLPGLAAGRYRVETWDTYKGVKLGEQTLEANAEGLAVPLPEVTTDVAVKAMKQ